MTLRPPGTWAGEVRDDPAILMPPCNLPQAVTGFGIKTIGLVHILEMFERAAFEVVPLPVKVVIVFVGGVEIFGGSQIAQAPC